MIFDLLTHFDPLKLQPKWRQKCRIWLKCQFSHRTVNHKKICNVPLDAVMYLLQTINDIESLSLTLHGVNACFIHHPSNLKNFTIGHKLETSQPKHKTRKPYGSKQSSFLVIMMICVMFCAGFCHGSWWFMSWFVVICSDLWFVVIHVMVNLWWFIVICGDLWWFMSSFVVVHVMVCGGLWYFHFHCSFSQDMGLLPLILIISRSYPYFVKVSCKSVENWLRYWPKRSVLVETWGCCPSFRSSRKVNPLREGFVQIHRELTEILTKTFSFSRNMGLLPLVPIVSKS